MIFESLSTDRWLCAHNHCISGFGIEKERVFHGYSSDLHIGIVRARDESVCNSVLLSHYQRQPVEEYLSGLPPL